MRTEKGETMVKVKVQRYVSGRVPKYAEGATSSEDEDDFIMSNTIKPKIKEEEPDEKPVELLETSEDYTDRRLQRLMRREEISARRTNDRHRDDGDDDEDRQNNEESDDDMDENLERKHALLLQKRRDEEEELLPSEDDEGLFTYF